METAIWARGVVKRYGGKNGKLVLDNLDMTVMKGTIYGLLGASGCGKTTLLSCIVGSKSIASGDIRVFGKLPGKASVQSVGYMPQDIALVGELTVRGALNYFGWIFGMSNEQIDTRFRFLNNLLDLPPSDRMIKNLSGGQQRRVSLAVVLVHNPDVLILDEPTVGLDPVLRQNIWDYLVELTEKEGKTIIITTHYIEEARQAHMIGLMRNGKLLSEGRPDEMMSKYHCTNVEDVFLLLSRKQQEGGMAEQEVVEIEDSDVQLEDISLDEANIGNINTNVTTPHIDDKDSFIRKVQKFISFTNKHHAKALAIKNFNKFLRNKGTLAYALTFPILQMGLFLLAIGGDPNTIKLGIVNREMDTYKNCQDYAADNRTIGGWIDHKYKTCNYTGLACKFVLGLPERLSDHVYFSNVEQAKNAMLAGKITAYVDFDKNFSNATSKQRYDAEKLTDDEFDQVQINVIVDKANYPVFMYLETKLLMRYEEFSMDIQKDCGYSPRSGAFPVQKLDAVYSSYDAKFREYMAPGFMLTVSVFLAVSISALTVVTERTEGSWERTLVAGVTTSEIVTFHFIIMSLLNFVQNIILFIVTFFIFGVECRGSLLTVLILMTLQGIVGTALGTFISVISKTVSECIFLSLGMFYPFVVLSGITWPIEGMHPILRYTSYYAVPATISVEALANVINRGWSLINFNVAKGLFSSVGWCILFNILNVVILKKKDFD